MKLALVLATVALAAPSRAARIDPLVHAVESVGITVSDLDRAVAFYRDVLTFEVLGEHELAGAAHESLEGLLGSRMRVARLRLGHEAIELTEYLAPEGRPIPADSRSNDHWFQHIAIVVSDMDAAYARLRANRVRHASAGPQRLPDWNPSAGGIEAFYFKDPDGHVLEVIAFPPDKGAAKWRELERRSNALFLGIDHTAIVVADTDASIAFYQGVLGLELVGASENHGTEQERLNSVFGARLRITALRAHDGPGVELLEYLSPSDGRPYPRDARANDLAHWETRFRVRGIEVLDAKLRGRRIAYVSTGVVALSRDTRALLVRDPDGHALELHEALVEPPMGSEKSLR